MKNSRAPAFATGAISSLEKSSGLLYNCATTLRRAYEKFRDIDI